MRVLRRTTGIGSGGQDRGGSTQEDRREALKRSTKEHTQQAKTEKRPERKPMEKVRTTEKGNSNRTAGLSIHMRKTKLRPGAAAWGRLRGGIPFYAIFPAGAGSIQIVPHRAGVVLLDDLDYHAPSPPESDTWCDFAPTPSHIAPPPGGPSGWRSPAAPLPLS